jgi:hypothetical protein
MSQSLYEDEIADGAMRAIFVSHWASRVERKVKVPEDEPDIHLIGKEAINHWENVAPKRIMGFSTFHKAAWRFIGHLEANNQLSLDIIFRLAMKADGHPFRAPDGYAFEFGRCLAYQCLGRGISWFDEHEKINLVLPSFDSNLNLE